ncbi:MAG: hypothetical protein CVU09_04085 [Bacteroidetes bacterium HGW-Bacteroidetes-4]|jgi:hypothetical protein|nr:MAG: hypothetical protein CVU09_04085 [Bacteroidetes bacterium HGW-Bacteroidetes-4]
MERLIKLLPNQQKVVFDKGNFDDWCVYVVEPNGERYAPKDAVYFSELQKIDLSYPENKVYNDFVSIYQKTTAVIDQQILTCIDNLYPSYLPLHWEKIALWFTVIYAGMVAEENKKGAILKKRIKRLGMYQVLMQQLKPEEAAGFSKGKSWRELDSLMCQLGF